MTEYGRIHTDGSRSGGQPVQSDAERVARALAQADGIEICSDATYALSSYGHKAQAALSALRQPTQSDALRIKLLEDALVAVVEATRAYLPPDGIDAKECLSRILGATDNPTINPVIFEIEDRAALQEQSK